MPRPHGPSRPGRRPHVHDIADHTNLPHVRFVGGPLDGWLVALDYDDHASGRWACVAGEYVRVRPERQWEWEPSA